MKRILLIIMAMIMLLSITTISYAATTKKTEPASTFKFFNGFYYPGKTGSDFLAMNIGKEDKSVYMTVDGVMYQLKYTKITQGKSVIKGTTLWIFTGSCISTRTKDDGTDLVSKPWKTTVTITFKDANTVVGVLLPKNGTEKGINFKGVMGLEPEGH
jgi:hypothetical protein